MATGAVARDPEPKPDTPATEGKQKGGRKGGKARARKLSAKRRREIAKRAALGRWRRQE